MGTDRVHCPACGAVSITGETSCWRCGKPFATAEGTATPKAPEDTAHPAPIRFTEEVEPEASPSPVAQPGSAPSLADRAPIRFGDDEPPALEPPAPRDIAPPPPATKLIWFGDDSEHPPEQPQAVPEQASKQPVPLIEVSPPTGSTPSPSTETRPQLMRLTYCKHCGHQNQEGATECARCHTPLEVVEAGAVAAIAPLPRTWGFDLLGVAWLVLGFAAVYCGRFMLKADSTRTTVYWTDYLWTGAVVCIPGVLVFTRHYFCKPLFWVMSLLTLFIWLVVGFVWLYVGLHVTDDGSVGFAWLGVLTGLTWISYLTVRANDEFDAAG